MTTPGAATRAPAPRVLPDATHAAIAELVAVHLAHRHALQAAEPLPRGPQTRPGEPGAAAPTVSAEAAPTPRVVEAVLVVPGRPGVVDVLAEVGACLVHLVVGLRAPGDEARFLPGCEDPVLGLFEDADGLAVAVDGLCDAEVAVALLGVVAERDADPALVRALGTDATSRVLGFDDRFVLSVHEEVSERGQAWTELLFALDDAGFNHLAAPVALWRRGTRDLGVVQERLAGAASGLLVAAASVRDLYAARCAPEEAGGDFAAEAERLGTMTARMHLCLDKAFGRRRGDPSSWAASLEAELSASAPEILGRTEVTRLLGELRALGFAGSSIRLHGDLELERVCRTEQGWFLDAVPAVAASAPAPPEPAEGSPLSDVADMLWSFGRCAASVAAEHDPAGTGGLEELTDAWVRRNCRAFLDGYLATSGIAGLLPTSRDATSTLVRAFELRHGPISTGPGT